MRDNYDFSDAIKNPFADMIKGKYNVTVHYDCTKQEGCEEYKHTISFEESQHKEDSEEYESKYE